MDRAKSELAAMEAIVHALSTLPDPDSRNRVLRWASEHFSAELVSGVTPAAAATQALVEATEGTLPAPTSESANRVDPENLESLFDNHHPAPQQKPAPPAPAVSSLESFVADFKKRAHDWRKT